MGMARSRATIAGSWRRVPFEFVASKWLFLWLFAAGIPFDQAHAIDRKIFDCGDPFSAPCVLDQYSVEHDYWFGRSEGSPARGPNPLGPPYASSTDVDELYDLMPSVHQYYLDKFGRNGVNGIGGSGTGVDSNFPTNSYAVLANANGSTEAVELNICAGSGNAWSSSSAGYVAFCAGTVDANSHDILGHEMFHLVSSYLEEVVEGNGESGAIGESVADFFGEALERYVTGSNNWLFWNRNGTFARDIANPPAILQRGITSPDRYLSQDYYSPIGNYYGVHYNAGILNKASYLAVEGGSFNGFNITGIGFHKVEQIWYRAVTTYMEPGETFNDAYNHLIQAATDLYSAADVWELTKALRAVEMHLSRDSLRGDYNGDGAVDAADYLVAKKELGTYYTIGAIEDWRIHFGMTAGPGNGATVPEPAGLTATLLAASWLVIRRQHRNRQRLLLARRGTL
jgi:hypothetical protein